MPHFLGFLFLIICTTLPIRSALADPYALPGTAPYDENAVSRFMYERHMLGMRVEYLHRVNIGDIRGLRDQLQDWMAWDCLAQWYLIQHNVGTAEERESAYDQLRLAAIQYEKYPVEKWKDNAQLMDVFRAAIAENPAHAESLRAKNWNLPMWLP
jgi:hypothetical protein